MNLAFCRLSFGQTITFSLSLMQTTNAISNTFEIFCILPTHLIEPVGLPTETAVLAVLAVPQCLFTTRITDAKPHFFFRFLRNNIGYIFQFSSRKKHTKQTKRTPEQRHLIFSPFQWIRLLTRTEKPAHIVCSPVYVIVQKLQSAHFCSPFSSIPKMCRGFFERQRVSRRPSLRFWTEEATQHFAIGHSMKRRENMFVPLSPFHYLCAVNRELDERQGTLSIEK